MCVCVCVCVLKKWKEGEEKIQKQKPTKKEVMGPVSRRANAAVRTARRRLSVLRRSILEHALLPSEGMMVWLLALLLLKLLLSKCLGDGPDIVISEELQLTRTCLLSYSTSTWTQTIVLESRKYHPGSSGKRGRCCWMVWISLFCMHTDAGEREERGRHREGGRPQGDRQRGRGRSKGTHQRMNACSMPEWVHNRQRQTQT